MAIDLMEHRAALRVGDLLDQISDAFFSFDRDWRFTYANRAAEEYLGRPRGELLGRVIWELFPASRGSELEKRYREAAAKSEPSEFELLAPIRERWIAVRAFPSADGLSVYFHDVTERRRQEEALRESEARYRMLFENSLDGVQLTRPDGTILRSNPAACAILGRTEEEIRRIGRHGIIDPHDPRLPALLEERRRTGRVRGELTMIRADGTPVPIEFSSGVFRDGDGSEMTSLFFHDVSRRKRAEESLQLLADAGALLQSSLDWDETLRTLGALLVPRVADVFALDLVDEGRTRRVAARHRDASRSEQLASLSFDADATASRGLWRVLRTGEPELVPVVTHEWLSAATGSEAHLRLAREIGATSVLMAPVIARGATLGVLSLARTGGTRPFSQDDVPLVRGIADRAALAIDNARLFAESVAARRARDEMLAVVSHDLRNPLHSIQVNAEVLARRWESRAAGFILSSVRRASRLVEDLLAVAAIESGKLPLSRRRESLARMLEELMQVQQPLAEQRSIVLETAIEPGAPDEVVLDRHRMLQALGNLVSNALKFTHEGGHIEVRVRAVGAGLEISVRDDGPGIPAGDRSRLFDRFWRGRSSAGGLGLGLAIVKGVAEAHGGTVAAESEPGRGAAFTISLPTGTDRDAAPRDVSAKS